MTTYCRCFHTKWSKTSQCTPWEHFQYLLWWIKQVFRNYTKWRLLATRAQVAIFFAWKMLQKAKLNANLRVLLTDWPQQVSLLELEKNHFPQSKESTLNLPLPTLVPKSMVSCVWLNLNSCLSRTWGKTLCEICCQRTCDTHFQIKHAQLTTCHKFEAIW